MKKLIFIALSLLTLPAFAEPLAQRQCRPDDIIEYPQSTICKWEPGSDTTSMQVTLHADKKTFPLIKASCTFVPKDKDKVVRVAGKKSALILGAKIENNNIKFDVINLGNDYNINVMFFLNKLDGSGPYTPGNELACSFSAPEVSSE